jgi:hypothetical protein
MPERWLDSRNNGVYPVREMGRPRARAGRILAELPHQGVAR